MIFVTVGSQLPFDRLVGGVDRWAASRGRDDVFAQIGIGGTRPRHIQWQEELSPQDFRENLRAADLLVAHAGCGTILQALSMGRAILVMPRRSDLREHRSDHQLATAARMHEVCGLPVAYDEPELVAQLDRFTDDGAPTIPTLRESASEQLLDTIRDFIVERRPQ